MPAPKFVSADEMACLLSGLRAAGFDSCPDARIRNGRLEVSWMVGYAVGERPSNEPMNEFWMKCGSELNWLHSTSDDSFAFVEPVRVSDDEVELFDRALSKRAAGRGRECLSIVELSLGKTSAIIHGDLSLGNLIVGRRSKFVGFIDWEYARRSPAALDLADICWHLLAHAANEPTWFVSVRSLLIGYEFPRSRDYIESLLIVVEFLVSRRIGYLRGLVAKDAGLKVGFEATLYEARDFASWLQKERALVVDELLGN